MDLAAFLARAWEFIEWFATMIITTVAEQLFGGWNAVLALALLAILLFVLTRGLARKHED